MAMGTQSARRLCLVAATAAAVLFSASADAFVADARTAQARRALDRTFPGVRVHDAGEHITAVYGRPMTSAPTPQQAAEWFLQDHADAFGVARPALAEQHAGDLSFGRFTVFAYQQEIDGLPVEGSLARILVDNGAENRVVYAAAKLTAPPAGGFQPDAFDGPAAVGLVQDMADYQDLTEWLPATMVIYPRNAEDDEIGIPVRAWRFLAHNTDYANYRSFTFFVDAANGRLVNVRDEVYHTDVSGHVDANATPGTAADSVSNPPAAAAMPNMNVSIVSGNSSTTDLAGDFTISNPGTTPLTVNAFVSGPWSSVDNTAGAEITGTASGVTPPGPANLLMNPTPSEFLTAQVNGFLHATITHNFYKSRRPAFTDLDISIPTRVNINDVCNAFFTNPISINFYRSGGGCANLAYSSIIAHEYGHWIVQELGLGQGAFGEGFGDSCGVVIYNDSVSGRDICGVGCHGRNIAAANQQYPCGSAIHTCGMVLAGTWWDMIQNFQATHGAGPGLEMVRQLFVDWSAITAGGIGSDSAHPQTAIEVLTVDDDDANINNGTPNFADICDAFAGHGIPCPELAGALFEYPNGRPATVTPNAVTAVRVDVIAGAETPVPGSGTVSYRIGNSGPFTTVAMSVLNPNEYEAALPAADCPERIEWYVSVDLQGGGSFTDPSNAPANVFATNAGTGRTELVTRDFEVSPGWTVSGSVTDGAWSRGVPVGGGDRGDPPTDFDGSGQCWLTDNVAGNSDVDGGTTILTSEAFDVSAMQDPVLSYARWYSNTFGDSPAADTFLVEISDNGSTWVTLEVVGPGGTEVTGGWYERSFYVSDFVNLTANVRVRFSASDLGAGSVVEAAIDALAISSVDECPIAPGPCGDFDEDGDVDLSDFATFGQCFGGSFNPPSVGCPAGVDADCDGDGDVDLGDFAIFTQNFTGSM